MNSDIVKNEEVIITTTKRRGLGTKESKVRIITEVFLKNGKKIAEHDPSPEKYDLKDMIDFARHVMVSKTDHRKLDKNDVLDWVVGCQKD